MYITVLCKVVDNFGDIGTAWRLCRRLAKIQSQYKLCLVVDDMEAFSVIEGNRAASADTRNEANLIIDGIEIFNWNDTSLCHEAFSFNDGERLQIILELFQCGRPDWMEKILFEEKLECTVHIIMIDYLTAEQYAEDFHCLQSLTRSSKVQKVNFMPGFTGRTGGLIIDDEWEELTEYNPDGDILVFTYENDWTELAAAIMECAGERKLLVAQGRGRESVLESLCALRQAQGPRGAQEALEAKIIELPFMPQTEWDKMMKNCSVLFVRGEESMSRACLSGIPFVWQAYPQSEEYQLVKVRALLERMRPHFASEDFKIVQKAWLAINTDQADASSLRAKGEAIHSSVYTAFFNAAPRLAPSFQDFAQSLRKNGDLCTNLMTFIKKLAII